MGVRVSPSAPAAPAQRTSPPGAGQTQEGPALAEDTTVRDLDAVVLGHLRGYPDELRRFANLTKQAHASGGSAVQFFLSRPSAGPSFLEAVCRLARDGVDFVTVVEAADVLGVPPSSLLDPGRTANLPAPIFGVGRYRLWRRADIAALRARRDAGG